LHCVRAQISDSDADDIVAEATAKFADVRASRCAEGAAMLVTCLPTNYKKYDDLIAVVMRVWPQLDHNPDWDCCWLTILCRARKVMTAFDWNKILPLLYIKAREHFSLPAVKGMTPRNSGFPVYYAKLLPSQQFDQKAVCVHKIAKLLYIGAISGPIVFAPPGTDLNWISLLFLSSPPPCQNVSNLKTEPEHPQERLRPQSSHLRPL
jgi:hypothetical protein